MIHCSNHVANFTIPIFSHFLTTLCPCSPPTLTNNKIIFQSRVKELQVKPLNGSKLEFIQRIILSADFILDAVVDSENRAVKYSRGSPTLVMLTYQWRDNNK